MGCAPCPNTTAMKNWLKLCVKGFCVFQPLTLPRVLILALALSAAAIPAASADLSKSPAFAKSVAEAAQSNDIIAAFYKSRAFGAFWTADPARLNALMAALDNAPAHGLPTQNYDAAALRAAAANAQTEGDLGRLDVALSAAFLAYARDISSGALNPSDADVGILREPVRPDPAALLNAAAITDNPAKYLRALIPSSAAYSALMVEKSALESRIAAGDWGQNIPANKLSPKDTGASVVALRDRLHALGYLPQTATATYDRAIRSAVQRFQSEQGLLADGVAGASTIAALNAAPQTRLASVIVALERLRWMGNAPLGARHIWVNQPDFTAKIVDNGRVTFRTRVVIGKDVPDQRSPEFSDEMEYMAINPSWGVPRSILVKEYLPLLKRNGNAVSHLQVVDGKGRVIPRGSVNFGAYSDKTFPFGLRQPPSEGNALGIVKFMFPNANNIYLHDTPAKSLFANEVRAYSHGCIRVADPVDLAYALLAPQSVDPKATFHTALDTGNETNVKLVEKVPVHLVYFTAFPNANGVVTYRNDVYGRDGRIYEALVAAGLVSALPKG